MIIKNQHPSHIQAGGVRPVRAARSVTRPYKSTELFFNIQIKWQKKTTAFLQSSGELAGVRTALAVTEGVPLVALARCGKYSRGNPANIASNEFCFVVLWRICLHIVINMVWSECLHTNAQTIFIKQRSCATKLRCDDKKKDDRISAVVWWTRWGSNPGPQH